MLLQPHALPARRTSTTKKLKELMACKKEDLLHVMRTAYYQANLTVSHVCTVASCTEFSAALAAMRLHSIERLL